VADAGAPAWALLSSRCLGLSRAAGAHLLRVYFGCLSRCRVLGLWNTTEKRGFRVFFHVFFFTAFAAAAALAFASLPVGTTADMMLVSNAAFRPLMHTLLRCWRASCGAAMTTAYCADNVCHTRSSCPSEAESRRRSLQCGGAAPLGAMSPRQPQFTGGKDPITRVPKHKCMPRAPCPAGLN
jgi:hypothetical protein